MSYLTTEASAQDAAPVELYTFRCGSDEWRYSSAETLRLDLQTYTGLAITRNEIQQAGEINKQTLTLKLPPDTPVLAGMLGGMISGVYTLAIARYHRSDGQRITVWKGRVCGVSWPEGLAELSCEPVFSSLRRIGLRRVYQTQCPHALYGALCGAARASFAVAASVTAIDGLTLTIPAAASHPDGWYAGGELVFGASRRMIVQHTGAFISVAAAVPGLTASQTVELAAGCDHTLSACRDKFSNLDNYGGQPWIPSKNPFTGDAIV